MSRERAAIPLKVKLAAALLQLRDGCMVVHPNCGSRLIPHDHAKQMTADQIISLFDLHHWPVEHAAGGPDEPWNLEFRLKADHKVETKKQAKVRAKVRRLRAKLVNVGDMIEVLKRHEPKRSWPKRKFPNRRTAWKTKSSTRSQLRPR